MIHVTGVIEKPEEVRISITATMTLEEWQKIRNALPRGWPCWKFADAIGIVLRSVEDRASKNIEVPE